MPGTEQESQECIAALEAQRKARLTQRSRSPSPEQVGKQALLKKQRVKVMSHIVKRYFLGNKDSDTCKCLFLNNIPLSQKDECKHHDVLCPHRRNLYIPERVSKIDTTYSRFITKYGPKNANKYILYESPILLDEGSVYSLAQSLAGIQINDCWHFIYSQNMHLVELAASLHCFVEVWKHFLSIASLGINTGHISRDRLPLLELVLEQDHMQHCDKIQRLRERVNSCYAQNKNCNQVHALLNEQLRVNKHKLMDPQHNKTQQNDLKELLTRLPTLDNTCTSNLDMQITHALLLQKSQTISRTQHAFDLMKVTLENVSKGYCTV